MEREMFSGAALLTIARCKSHEALTQLARNIREAFDRGDVTEAQYGALVKAGKQRRDELNGREHED